ncbi:hypothetical protein RhiirA5_417136 [Rhizophagus irregularis]|uniref:Uncharacterized protein n=1 Tax=Rhizophagus irregularis TaxID=588596 RepID=A0A2I1F576_9GLOM|nr:hypothetical protein RhiirA5_417136 [Rhizophagus irregularis]PKY29533.1 hypothetical protein RhiirB3_446192 [Rhizophagus irregularis]
MFLNNSTHNINEINYSESILKADWYVNNIPMLKLAKEGFIEIEHAPNAVGFLEWETKQGAVKSTNRIDDIGGLHKKHD